MLEYKQGIVPELHKLLELYNDAGWTAYTIHPERLERAVSKSLAVYTAWEGETLVGLLRTVGDGEAILYVQDILVRKSHQRRGIGKTLLTRALEDNPTVRQKVLMTDDLPETAAFYRACGLRPCGEYGGVAFCRYD